MIRPHKNLIALGLVGLLLGITLSRTSQAQRRATRLPSESELPGQLGVAGRALPDEGRLPAAFRRPTGLVANRIPTESELPTLDKQEVKTLSVQQTPQPAALGEQVRGLPWLRINQRGHMSTVRSVVFTNDGLRLCSAGFDKELYVWKRIGLSGQAKRWAYERTVRWPIQRGIRGRIYVLDTHRNLLAMAGHGAYSDLGYIALIDTTSGELKKIIVDDKNGHRQPIQDLQFSPDGKSLASIDREGHVIYWTRNDETGAWIPRTISERDAIRYPNDAARLENLRRRSAVATDGRYVVYARFRGIEQVAPAQPPRPVWTLERFDLRTGRRASFSEKMYDFVTSIDISDNGQYVAAGDWIGFLRVWQLGSARAIKFAQRPRGIRAAILSVDFRAGSNELATGMNLRGATSELCRWTIDRSTTPIERVILRAPVYDVRYNADGSQLAFTAGTRVAVRSMVRAGRPQLLNSEVRPPTRIAFAKSKPVYRLAFSTRRDEKLDGVFQPGGVKLDSKQVDEKEWLKPNLSGGWNVLEKGKFPNSELFLYFNGKQAAKLPVIPEFHGFPKNRCWLTDDRGKVVAVAIDGSRHNMIQVYKLASDGVAPLLRQFRGHSAGITSIAVSADRRYLASASLDGTIRYWPLGDYLNAKPLVNRWGATFVVQNNQLLVDKIDENGRAYFRGLRAGDLLTRLSFSTKTQTFNASAPAQMLQMLRASDPQTLLVFQYQRGRTPQPGFQIYPAWQQIAALHVAANREWAFWSPSGYYDASFDGHKLFGWLFNRGRSRLPEFFFAAQLRKAFERPDVMKHLISEGSLNKAFQLARLAPPTDPSTLLSDKFRLRPVVTILSPAFGASIKDRRLKLQATIQVRAGQTLVPPKAFANGVVAQNPVVVDSNEVAGGRSLTYEWDAGLPADKQILLQVVAATDAEVVGADNVLIEHTASSAPRRSRLFVLSAGVNKYRDAQIERLDYATRNAERVVDALSGKRTSLYETQAVTLLDNKATPAMWKIASSQLSETLRKQVSPDDLLVIFLSGHGIRDPRTGEYYFLTPNASYQDVRAGRYRDCLAFSDLAAFGKIPCRKLVILDTCHSGAVQPLQQQNLKAAVRALQDDMVFTLTASEGTQEAIESRDLQLGLFTHYLLKGLSGAADRGGDQDGVVTFREVARYVRQTVSGETFNGAFKQHPTAGPIELLDLARIPLLKVPTR